MADKFGVTNHCLELYEPCNCKGTGYFLLLQITEGDEAVVYSGYACHKCFGLGGRTPHTVGGYVKKPTNKSWDKVLISDLVQVKSVTLRPIKKPLITFPVPKRDSSDRDIKDFISEKPRR